MDWHYEYITRSGYLRDGRPWPMRNPSVVVSGEWYKEQKLILIKLYREYQSGQYSADDCSIGLAVWWIERIRVDDTPPPPPAALSAEPSDYEKLREELQV